MTDKEKFRIDLKKKTGTKCLTRSIDNGLASLS